MSFYYNFIAQFILFAATQSQSLASNLAILPSSRLQM